MQSSEGLLACLKRACKNFRNGHARESLAKIMSTKGFKASETFQKLAQPARKTQQHSPPGQIFNLSPTRPSSIPLKIPPRAPRAMNDDGRPSLRWVAPGTQTPRPSGLVYSTQRQELPARGPSSQRMSELDGRMANRERTQSRPRSSSKASRKQAKRREGRLSDYHALQNNMSELEERLANANAAIKAVDANFDDLKVAKTHQIDIDAKQRHDRESKTVEQRHAEEIRLIRQRHKDEVLALKREHTALKKQHESKRRLLYGRRDSLMREQKLLEERIKRSREDLALDETAQLLDALEAK